MTATTDSERIAVLEMIIQEHETRLETIKEVEQNIAADLASNTESTRAVEASTQEIVEFFNSVSGAFKVLHWIGKLAMPIGAIISLGLAIAALWHSFKTGVPHT